MKRKVKCPGCKKLRTQLAPRNRDYKGKSWHYDCLVQAISNANNRRTV